MFGKVYDPGIMPNELVAGSRAKPFNMPSRAELIKRNSFPGPDRNRYIDRFIRDAKSGVSKKS